MSPVRHSGMPLPNAPSRRAKSSSANASTLGRRPRPPAPPARPDRRVPDRRGRGPLGRIHRLSSDRSPELHRVPDEADLPRVPVLVVSDTRHGRHQDHGHIHVGTCFPHAQKIAGVVRFDVRVIMHNNPGTLTHVNIGIVGESFSCGRWPSRRTGSAPLRRAHAGSRPTSIRGRRPGTAVRNSVSGRRSRNPTARR